MNNFTEEEIIALLEQPAIRLFHARSGNWITSHDTVRIILKMKKALDHISDGIVKAANETAEILESK